MAELIDVVLSELVLDPELQPRKSLHAEKVEEYAQCMKDGACFPPIHCGRLKGGDRTLYLLDGFHRVEAIKSLGTLIVPGTVEEYNTREDMFVYAFRVNSLHGIDLTDEENDDGIIRIIQMFPGDSENVLAEKTGWSRSKIHRCIKQLVQVNKLVRPEKTIGKDGKERPSTRPAKQPDYALCPQCGAPIWPENKGNPDYTYTERSGQWFCSPECADQWEQERLSDGAEAITGIPDELPDPPSAALPTGLNSLPVCDMEEPDLDSLPIAEDDEPDDNAVVVECIIPIRVPGITDPKEAFAKIQKRLPLVVNAGSDFEISASSIYLNNLNLKDLNITTNSQNSENFTEWSTRVIHKKKVSRKYVTKAKFEEWQKEYAGKINVAQCLTDWCKYWDDRRGDAILKADFFWTCAKNYLEKQAKEASGQRNRKSPYRDESGLTSQEGY